MSIIASIRGAIAPGTKLGSIYRKTIRYCRITATIFSVPSAIISAVVLVQPKISVESKDHMTKLDGVIFLIKNEGHITLYNIDPYCRYATGHIAQNVSFATIYPGKSISTECSTPHDNVNYSLGLTVNYSWFFDIFNSQEKFDFKVRYGKDSNVVMLVPVERR